jgi:uncharacterized integral membrane protein
LLRAKPKAGQCKRELAALAEDGGELVVRRERRRGVRNAGVQGLLASALFAFGPDLPLGAALSFAVDLPCGLACVVARLVGAGFSAAAMSVRIMAMRSMNTS